MSDARPERSVLPRPFYHIGDILGLFLFSFIFLHFSSYQYKYVIVCAYTERTSDGHLLREGKMSVQDAHFEYTYAV